MFPDNINITHRSPSHAGRSGHQPMKETGHSALRLSARGLDQLVLRRGVRMFIWCPPLQSSGSFVTLAGWVIAAAAGTARAKKWILRRTPSAPYRRQKSALIAIWTKARAASARLPPAPPEPTTVSAPADARWSTAPRAIRCLFNLNGGCIDNRRLRATAIPAATPDTPQPRLTWKSRDEPLTIAGF